MHKRIILVGPTASGKNFIRDKFREKGYKIDCSYTTRSPREGELEAIDYHFVTPDFFSKMADNNHFYESVKYGEFQYGTGVLEWRNMEVFIMETDGVEHITVYDRKECLVIYINTSSEVRVKRMAERGWDDVKITERIRIDNKNFDNFKDYDLQIKSE